MKKLINSASSISEKVAIIHAKAILKHGKQLLDTMENTPDGFLENNDLRPLYDELIEVLPALDFAINSNSVDTTSNYDLYPED